MAHHGSRQQRLAPACIHRAPPLHPASHGCCNVTPSGAEALRETGGRWVPRHRPAGRPAAERVWSKGLAAVKRPPPSALSLGALGFGTRRQQTQGTGPWARGAELHCTEPELRFAVVPALGLTCQAPGHPGPVAKSFSPRPQLQDMQACRQTRSGAGLLCFRMATLPSTAPSTSPPLLPLPLHRSAILPSSQLPCHLFSTLLSCCVNMSSWALMRLCGHDTRHLRKCTPLTKLENYLGTIMACHFWPTRETNMNPLSWSAHIHSKID